VPGGGLAGICGVESGKAAPLVGGPPGAELHTVVEALPSGVVGETFPVVVGTIGVGMVPNADPGVVGDIVAADDIVVAVVPDTDVETLLGAVDGADTGIAVIEGDGSGGTGGGCGACSRAPSSSSCREGCWRRSCCWRSRRSRTRC